MRNHRSPSATKNLFKKKVFNEFLKKNQEGSSEVIRIGFELGSSHNDSRNLLRKRWLNNKQKLSYKYKMA